MRWQCFTTAHCTVAYKYIDILKQKFKQKFNTVENFQSCQKLNHLYSLIVRKLPIIDFTTFNKDTTKEGSGFVIFLVIQHDKVSHLDTYSNVQLKAFEGLMI